MFFDLKITWNIKNDKLARELNSGNQTSKAAITQALHIPFITWCCRQQQIVYFVFI